MGLQYTIFSNNIPKFSHIYQIQTKSIKMSKYTSFKPNIPVQTRAFEIYQFCKKWFRNIPPGNTVVEVYDWSITFGETIKKFRLVLYRRMGPLFQSLFVRQVDSIRDKRSLCKNGYFHNWVCIHKTFLNF